MKKNILITALFVIMSVLVFAEPVNTWYGRTGAQILRVNPALRSVALGGGYISGIDGVEALSINPAGLTKIDRRMFAAGDSEFVDMRVIYLAYGQKYGKLYFGVEVKGIYDSIDAVDDSGDSIGSVTYYNVAPTFGVGMKVTPSFSLGVSATALYEDYSYVSSFTWALNGGIQMSFFHDVVRFGGSVRNFAFSDISYYEGSTVLMPLVGNAGVSYVFKDNDLLDKIIITADIEVPYERDFIISGGAEYMATDWFKLRAAYRLNSDNDIIDNITFGLELKESVKKMTGALSYAYMAYGDVIGTHRLSYTMYW